MKLEMLQNEFSICKLPDIAELDLNCDFLFFARTEKEISCVCETDFIPKNALQTEPGWRAFRVAGILDFSMTGVIARISGILAAESLSVFVVSTYDTDYVLIKEAVMDQAVSTLEKNGYTFN